MAGRILGPGDYALFMIAWGFVFFEIGLLQGLFQEVTRGVASGRVESPDSASPAHPALVAFGMGVTGAAILVVTSATWAPRLFGPHWLLISVSAGVAFLGYALNAAINGGLAGRRRWRDVSLSILVESIVRLVVVLTIISTGRGAAPQSWGLATAGFAWVLLLAKRSFRAAVRERTDCSSWRLVGGAAHAMTASACSALLISGFPVLLQITSPSQLSPQAGVLLAAVVATRAPLLLPLNAFQAVLLARFVAFPERMRQELSMLTVAVAAVTASGALVASVLGPWLMLQVYGEQFRLSGIPIGLLVVGAGLVAIQTLSGSALMARGQQRLFAAGWLTTTAASIALLMLDLPVQDRVVVALTAGPAAGILVNYIGLRRDRESG